MKLLPTTSTEAPSSICMLTVEAASTDLEKYDAEGVKIRYSIKEDTVKRYETAITGNAGTGFTVTNTKTDIPRTGVKKITTGCMRDSCSW